MYGAQELNPAEAPELYAMVRELALRASLPMPRLYLIPEEAPNAFATGRDPQHGVVAVTQGLRRLLNRDEVAGVTALELAHIKHRDTLVMRVAATLAGALSMLANAAMWGSLFGSGRSSEDEEHGSHPLTGLRGIIVAPVAATLIQMAISRWREFVADEAAARVTGKPLALARAAENRGLVRAVAHGLGLAGHRSPLHPEPVRRRWSAAAVQHASTYQGPGGAAGGHGYARVCCGGLRLGVH